MLRKFFEIKIISSSFIRTHGRHDRYSQQHIKQGNMCELDYKVTKVVTLTITQERKNI